MAHIDADRVKETTTTIGTGAITLAGAVVGFRSFSSAMSIGDTCSYAVVSATGLEWETGIGTYSGATTLTRTTIKSSANNTSPPTAMAFTAGVKDVFVGPIAGTLVPYNPVTGALNLGVDALNDVAITSPTSGQVIKYSGTAWTNQADAVNVGTVTSVAATAGTGISVTGSPITGAGTLNITNTAPDQTVSLTAGTGISATGTYPNFTVGLGSLTSAQLASALSDETGTGANVFATSPTLVTPVSNSLSAVPVGSGAGNSLTLTAGSGVGTGAGGSLILQAGLQATSGGDGKVVVRQVSGQTGNLQEWQTSAGTTLLSVSDAGGYPRITGVGGASSISIGNYIDFSGFCRFFTASAFYDYIAVTRLLSHSGTTSVVVQARSGQTSNLQEWQDSAGTVLGVVTAAGNVGIGTASPSTKLEVIGGIKVQVLEASVGYHGSNPLLTLYGTEASYTGELRIWHDQGTIYFGSSTTGSFNNNNSISLNSGNVYFSIPIDCAHIRSPAHTALTFTQTGIPQDITFITQNTSERLRIKGDTGNVGIGTTSPGRILDVGGESRFRDQLWLGATDTSGLLTWNSAYVFLCGVGSQGFKLATGTGTVPLITGSSAGNVLISNVIYPATVPLTVQGAASQTANLQEWKNSAGTALSYVNATGNPFANSLSAVPVASGAGNSLTLSAGAGVGTGAGGSLILQAGLQATSGGDGKVIVKQVAGQTGNLQEWQTSAGTALLSVSDSGGYPRISSPFSNIALGNYIDFNGTGRFNGAVAFNSYITATSIQSGSTTGSVTVQGGAVKRVIFKSGKRIMALS